MSQGRVRRTFTKEFKVEAVQLSHQPNMIVVLALFLRSGLPIEAESDPGIEPSLGRSPQELPGSPI